MSRELIAETFLEMHAEEKHDVRPLPGECPVCQIQTEDTLVSFAMALNEKIEPIVESYLVRWDRLGLALGNKTDCIPDGLSLAITEAILAYPVVPKNTEQGMGVEDIVRHPYVSEKFKEMSKTK